jgi:hypothetical protein
MRITASGANFSSPPHYRLAAATSRLKIEMPDDFRPLKFLGVICSFQEYIQLSSWSR